MVDSNWANGYQLTIFAIFALFFNLALIFILELLNRKYIYRLQFEIHHFTL